MALFDIDGTGEKEYVASVYTMMLYEQEFGSSLIKDFYGKVSQSDDSDVVTAAFVKEKMSDALPDGKTLPKTTVTLIDKAFPASKNSTVDFTKTNWEAALQVMWAMAKTADDSIPSWKKWAAALGPINLGDVVVFVMGETQRGLFRAAGKKQ